MVIIGAFPVFKLSVLFADKISKPISNFLKKKAEENAIFRNYICIPPAQAINYLESKIKLWSMNMGRSVSVQPLTEPAAIDLAANFLSKAIVFVMYGTGLTYEYKRKLRKKKKKQAAMLLEQKNLKAKISKVNVLLEQQEKQIAVMTKLVKDLRSKRSITE